MRAIVIQILSTAALLATSGAAYALNPQPYPPVDPRYAIPQNPRAAWLRAYCRKHQDDAPNCGGGSHGTLTAPLPLHGHR